MALTTAGRNLVASLVAGSGNPLNAANGHIGVGDSNTAFNASQTDLVASTNKFRKQVSGAPGIASNVVTYAASFGSGEANFAWAEWGLFNASSSGTMLCRKVASHGTKASGDTWVFTVEITWTAA